MEKKDKMTIPLKIIPKEEYDSRFGKPNQEQVWDEISDLWNEYRKEPFGAVKDFLNKASSDFLKYENLKIPKDKMKVIDLGCGSGRNMIALKNIEYYGVDISSCQLGCAIVHADEKGINAKFFKNKADKLSRKDFKEEMFDYGLFIATLHCLENKQAREKALKELYRVLKKNAEALISVWNSDDKRFNGLKGDVYMSWRKDGKDHMRYYYLYDRDEFLDLVKSVGFEILKIYKEKKGDRFSRKNWILRVRK